VADRTGIFAGDDPFEIARAWMKEAEASELNDPNAMAMASVDETGLPNVRMVLLKEIEERTDRKRMPITNPAPSKADWVLGPQNNPNHSRLARACSQRLQK